MGAGSSSHYVTGYHGPGCSSLDIVFSPIGIISYAREYNIIYKYNYLAMLFIVRLTQQCDVKLLCKTDNKEHCYFSTTGWVTHNL